MARASLLYHDKTALPEGRIVEMIIWTLPQATTERPHGLKYRLYYGRAGVRIVDYDNEEGKGDHRHLHGREEVYAFTTVEQWIADFLADVARERPQ